MERITKQNELFEISSQQQKIKNGNDEQDLLDIMVKNWKNLDRIKASLDPIDRVHPLSRIFNIATVAGLEKSQGILLVAKHALYIAYGYLIGDNEVVTEIPEKEIAYENLSSSIKKKSSSSTNQHKKTSSKIVFENSNNDNIEIKKSSKHIVKRIRYEGLRELHKRRFLFRETGLEFFAHDNSNFLVVFETKRDRDWLHSAVAQEILVTNQNNANLGLVQEATTRTGGNTETIILQSGNNDENEGGLASLVGASGWKRQRDKATRDWLQGKISNFGYLMVLNTLAGRSFNDITQYPVFPWILSDYSSNELDLSNPNSFRDLSKPMGALSNERAAVVLERYQSMEANGDIPFHYGTHYSCSAYVLHYLIRLEPYTAAALELQGGSFDHPDRLFKSIESTWKSAAGLLDNSFNVQDVRELVPEFYYLPEFLVNSNKFQFGTTQAGEDVNNVELPPWAKGSAREFIRLHRKALESRYVSENLHLWIDLIFGSSQRNKEAVAKLNVFHRYTYEGQVNLEEINDPTAKAAAESFIHNFGQTPTKLFTKPHPRKIVPVYPSINSKHIDVNIIQWHSKLSPSLVVPGSHVRPHYSLFPNPEIEQTGVPGTIKLVPIPDGSTFAPALGGPMGSLNYTAFLPLGSAIPAVNNSSPSHGNTTLVQTGGIIGGGGTGNLSNSQHQQAEDPITVETTLSSLVRSAHYSVSDMFIRNEKVYMGTGPGVRLATTNRYFVFGGDDGTLVMRGVLGALQGSQDKILAVFAGLHQGRISAMTVVDDDGVVLVTGGSDATVSIWRTSRDVNWRIDQLASLSGHTDTIRCIDANIFHDIAITGSDDGTCILWDLGRKCYIRTLKKAGYPIKNRNSSSSTPSSSSSSKNNNIITNISSPSNKNEKVRNSSTQNNNNNNKIKTFFPVTSVSINGENGNFFTVAGRIIRAWSINGDLIAETDVGINLDGPTCAVATSCPDYLPGIVLVTGHKKGQVCLWDFIYPGGEGDPLSKQQNNATINSTSRLNQEKKPIFAVRIVLTSGHRHAITSLCVSPDQRQFASADMAGRIVHWVSCECSIARNYLPI